MEAPVKGELNAANLASIRWCTSGKLSAAYREVADMPKRETDILRDVFGNPLRPVIINPASITSNVRQLAELIYADRAFDRLPLLADALEEVGCDNADILAHCRGPGPHVRGCWVVDLLLGKE